MRILVNSIGVLLAILSFSSAAQSQNSVNLTAAPPDEWQELSDMDFSLMKGLLTAYGFSDLEIARALNDELNYQVFTKSNLAGLPSYLAVPRDGSAPTQFDPPVPATWTGINPTHYGQPLGTGPTNANLFQSTATWARTTLIQQLEETLKMLCQMPARPTTIRAKASVPGLEVEGEWMAEDVCKDS